MSLLLAVLLATQTAGNAVPGQCTAHASEHVGEPGCYLSAEFDIEAPSGELYWHIYVLPTLIDARVAATHAGQAVAAEAHGQAWLHVMGDAEAGLIHGATVRESIGPIRAPSKGRVRLLESWFPPGMKTRAHSHPGPEVFYVLEGEQCVETRDGIARVAAGEHYILDGGPHLQASPNGRRSLILLVIPDDTPWMSLESDWRPKERCSDD
jgi:quercetin dioxygenase-like cupin family protein